MSQPSLNRVALGITALEFLEELDALLAKHGARLVIQHTHRELALQTRFKEHELQALTLARGRPGKGAVTYAGDGFAGLEKG